MPENGLKQGIAGICKRLIGEDFNGISTVIQRFFAAFFREFQRKIS